MAVKKTPKARAPEAPLTKAEQAVERLVARERWPYAVLKPDFTVRAGKPSPIGWRKLIPQMKLAAGKSGLSVAWPKGTRGAALPLAGGGWMLLGPFRGRGQGPDAELLELIRSLVSANAVASQMLTLKAHTLHAVLHLGRSLSTIKDMRERELVASEMVKDLVQILEADRASVFLIDRERGELYSLVALGSEIKEIRFPIDKGIAGFVARTGKPLNVRDAYQDKRFNPEFDQKTGYRTRSVLAVPMADPHGQRVGVVQVINKKNASMFKGEDQELLTAIASEAAISIINMQLIEEQRQLVESFISTMVTAMESRDELTSGHTMRVTEYAMGIARTMDLPRHYVERIRIAGMLHDMGKINTPDAVLKKPGGLTKEERAIMERHAAYTRYILRNLRLPAELKELPDEAALHHERVDGSGYPDGLKGDSIPFVARILAVADVFDAVTSKRHYREAMPIEDALEILRKGSGTHFDPKCVEAFMKYFEKELRASFVSRGAGRRFAAPA